MSADYDSAHLLVLQRRLLTGDRIASEELIHLLLSPLFQEVRRKFSKMDEQVVWDGVTDAVLDYCARPQQFDESRGVPLDRFLQQAAWRNVANLYRGEKRRKAREEKARQDPSEVSVALDSPVGNILQQEEMTRRQRRQEQLMNVLQNPKDRQLFALRLQGERRTEKFAEILGIRDLPIEAQRREVKRNKDRIDQILRRHRGDSL